MVQSDLMKSGKYLITIEYVLSNIFKYIFIQIFLPFLNCSHFLYSPLLKAGLPSFFPETGEQRGEGGELEQKLPPITQFCPNSLPCGVLPFGIFPVDEKTNLFKQMGL